MRELHAEPLTQEEYQAYGDVISARSDIPPIKANSGTAARYNFLSSFENLRPQNARLNLCLFRSNAQITGTQKEFSFQMLEHHAFSTQAFIPMGGVNRYLVIVCLGKDKPDLTTCRAFLAKGDQGITYKPGVWHHPLIAMDRLSDFSCLVWENGTEEDGFVSALSEKVTVRV